MPRQIVAYKDKDGSLYESKEDAIKEEFGSVLFDFFSDHEEKYQLIDRMKEAPHELRELIDNHYPTQKKRK